MLTKPKKLEKGDTIAIIAPSAGLYFQHRLDNAIAFLNKAVTTTEPIGIVSPSQSWTGEFLDWSEKLDLTRPRKLERNDGFEWLREGKAKGKIIGGCLESIVHLPGTKYWPDYKDKVLFLEISEGQKFDEGDPLAYVDWYLEQLSILGVFEQIKGLIFGRPYNYSKEDTELLKKKIIERTKECTFPILFGADIGHTDPQITIPIGVEVGIDSETKTFEFLESGIE